MPKNEAIQRYIIICILFQVKIGRPANFNMQNKWMYDVRRSRFVSAFSDIRTV